MARLGRIKNGLMVAMRPTNIKLVRRKEQMDEYLAKITDHTTNEIIEKRYIVHVSIIF